MSNADDEWSVMRVFEAIDVDSSGSIEADELEMAMSAVLGKAVSKEDVENVMKKYDTNNDGVLDLMEFSQFIAEVDRKK